MPVLESRCSTATNSANLDTYVDSGATVRAGSDLQVISIANNDADADTTGIGGGAVAVGIFLADATAGGASKARMNGTVTSAGNVLVSAKSDFDANAYVFGAQVGAVSVSGQKPTACTQLDCGRTVNRRHIDPSE